MIQVILEHTQEIPKEIIDFDFTSHKEEEVIELVKDLAETMIVSNQLGLSAPQINSPYNIMGIMAEKIIIAFNPRVVDESEETIVLEEMCASYPGLVLKVKRPKLIRVRYEEPSGETVTKKFDGMTSRIFQHNMDYLQGTNFLDKANKIHKEQAMKKWDKWKKNNEVR